MFTLTVFAPLCLFYDDNPLISFRLSFVSANTALLGTSALLKIQACWIMMSWSYDKQLTVFPRIVVSPGTGSNNTSTVRRWKSRHLDLSKHQ